MNVRRDWYKKQANGTSSSAAHVPRGQLYVGHTDRYTVHSIVAVNGSFGGDRGIEVKQITRLLLYKDKPVIIVEKYVFPLVYFLYVVLNTPPPIIMAILSQLILNCRWCNNEIII